MAIVFLSTTLIDGTGMDPRKDMAVVLDKGYVTQVGHVNKVSFDPKVDNVIDAGDGAILPGLIDCHCHIFYIIEGHRRYPPLDQWKPEDVITHVISGLNGARWWLSQGVTTVRDLGSIMNLDLGLRDLIAKGKVLGPRIFGSGKIISMRGESQLSGHEVSSAEEARRAAREQIHAGADVIKLFASAGVGGGCGKMIGEAGWEQLTLEEMQAAAFEAHKAGRTVAVHALSAKSIKNAVLAGADSIEHGHYADEESFTMMKEANVVLVPTLAIGETLMRRGTEFGFGPHMEVNAKKAVELGNASIEMARSAGVRIAVGTDPVRQDTVAHECLSLCRAGLTPMEVLVAATRVGAELLHIQDRLGTLEPGKIADLIVVDGNPLDDLTALERVRWVVREGQIVKSPEETLRGRNYTS